MLLLDCDERAGGAPPSSKDSNYEACVNSVVNSQVHKREDNGYDEPIRIRVRGERGSVGGVREDNEQEDE
jgi:hypothetical protein